MIFIRLIKYIKKLINRLVKKGDISETKPVEQVKQQETVTTNQSHYAPEITKELEEEKPSGKRIWMHNDFHQKLVYESEIEKYITLGYTKGKITHKK